MEKSKNGEILLSKEQKAQIFGPPPPRKPIPCNSFNTLVRIFSLFPHQNPFSLPGDGHRVEKGSSDELVSPASVHNHVEDANFSGLEDLDEMIMDAMCSDMELIDNISMEEFDDMGVLRLPEKDFSFDNTLAADKLTVEGDVSKYQGYELSNQVEVTNQHADTCLENLQLCQEKVTNEVSELEGLIHIAKKCANKGALIPIGNSATSIDKGNATKAKTKKASLNDVFSGKHKHISVRGEAPNSTTSKCVGKMVKQHEGGSIRKPSMRKVKKGQGRSSKGVQYTREQLLCLQNNTSDSENILRALQENVADLLYEGQPSVAEEPKVSCSDKRKASPFEGNIAEELLQVINGANEGKQSSSTENKLTKEEKTDSSILKKKKRGSSSEARKEKKKRQRNKKRAELNKKLGVKRLKLKPVLKPKVVSHCRHYLMGRCHEGENCKFSHDVIPVTKSKPCCHFARNACMKGDECPFDHQLSKYPCNNYVTTGFCVRGDSCSFSHKAPSIEHAEPVSLVSKCDSSSLLQLDESNSKQRFSSALGSGYATPNNLKGNSVKLINKPTNAPRGISFLSFGKTSVEDSCKHQGGELSQQNSVLSNIVVGSSKRTDDGTGTTECAEPVSFVSKYNSNSLLQLDKSNSKQKLDASTSKESGYATINSQGNSLRLTSQPANAPKGISFLSFGKSSAEDSSKHREVCQQNSVLPNMASGSFSKRSDYGAGINDQLSQGLSSRAVNFSQIFEVNKAQKGPMDIQAPIPTRVHTDSLIGEIGNVKESNKLKTIQTELWDSSTSLSQCSVKVDGARSAPNAAVKSLSSTLAFAEKYVSGIKMTTVATSGEVDKHGGTASDSGSKQKDESSAAVKSLSSTLAFAEKYGSGIKMTPVATCKEVDTYGGSTSDGRSKQKDESKVSSILEFLYRK